MKLQEYVAGILLVLLDLGHRDLRFVTPNAGTSGFKAGTF